MHDFVRPIWLGLSLALLVLACSDSHQPRVAPEDIRQALSLRHYRGSLTPRVEHTSRRRDVILERVRFQGRRGDDIPALICYSEMARARPMPAILCMPGSPNRKEDLLHPLDLLPRWAEQGFFVISIDRPHHGARTGTDDAAFRVGGLAKVWGESVYDLMRALDYVETRTEADASRTGMLGLSLGAMEALLMAALDPRIDVVVSIAGQLTWGEVFGTSSWQLIFRGLDLTDQLRRDGISGQRARLAFLEANPGLAVLDASLLAPLIAPKPMLLMTGGDDPYITPAATRHTYDAARPAYEDLEQEDRLELWLEEDMGHAFSAAMQERALDWFVRWL